MNKSTDMRNLITNYSEIFYLLCSGGAAFLMAILRNGGFTRRNMAMRCTEALMCSLLSSAITICMHAWLDWDYQLGMPIGTFVGFLGTGFIQSLIKTYVKGKVAGK